MRLSWIFRFGFVAIALVCAALAVSASTASNTVPTSHAAKLTRTITANDIKPSACSSITMADLVIGSGTVDGRLGQRPHSGSCEQ